jgi:hypothetical protein
MCFVEIMQESIVALTIQIAAGLLIVIFCTSCNAEGVESTRQDENEFDKAVLSVNRGLYASSARTVEIVDPDKIARLHNAFARIKVGSTVKPRADWKPQGTLTFYRNGKEQRKAILGISEWTQGGASALEYPLQEDLRATLKELAGDKTLDGSE